MLPTPTTTVGSQDDLNKRVRQLLLGELCASSDSYMFKYEVCINLLVILDGGLLIIVDNCCLFPKYIGKIMSESRSSKQLHRINESGGNE